MKTNILVLAAGQVVPDEQGNGYPICLAELEGLSIIERIVKNTCAIPNAKYAFALFKHDTERFHLDKVVKLLIPDAEFTITPESTCGSACTALLAACKLPQDSGLLIVSANELVDIDLSQVVKDFQSRNLDGGTLTFRSIHPRYSYVLLNPEGLVIEAAQQKPISQNATVGVFWFKNTGEFVEAVKSTIRKNAVIANKFYVAPAFNELILLQKNVGVFELETNQYRPLKTEQQLQHFERGT